MVADPWRAIGLSLLALVASSSCKSDKVDQAGDAGDLSDGAVEDPCSAAFIQASLDLAVVGQVVELGACQVEGQLTVPAGVTLQGSSTAESIVLGGVRLEPGSVESPTTLSTLAVKSPAGAAVVAEGSGSVQLQGLELRVNTGIGIGLDTVEALLEDLVVQGPVNSANALEVFDLIDGNPEPWKLTGSNGLIALRSTTTVNNVSILGFASGASLFAEGQHAIANSTFGESLGTGIRVFDASASLSVVEVRDIFAGGLEAKDVAAFWADEGSSLQSTQLHITRGEGVGLLEKASSAAHENLVVSEQAQGGYWIVDSVLTTSVSGTDSSFAANDFVGIGVVNSEDVSIHDATITGTGLKTGSFGGDSVELGDGVYIEGSQSGLSLSDLLVEESSRVGVLIDLDGETFDANKLSNLVIDAPIGTLALVVQNGTIPDGALTGTFAGKGGAPGVGVGGSDGLAGDFCSSHPESCTGDGLGIIAPNNIISPNNIIAPNNLLDAGLAPFL